MVGAGYLLFGTGNLNAANIGRFMQGAGGVFALVGAVYIATKNFPASRAATLIGATQMFGMARIRRPISRGSNGLVQRRQLDQQCRVAHGGGVQESSVDFVRFDCRSSFHPDYDSRHDLGSPVFAGSALIRLRFGGDAVGNRPDRVDHRVSTAELHFGQNGTAETPGTSHTSRIFLPLTTAGG